MDDLPAIARIGAECNDAPQWTLGQYSALLHDPRDRALTRTVLVAQFGERIAGFAVVSALCSITPPEAELESLAVEPAHRQRGIGKALLSATVTWAQGQLAVCLHLEVRTGNIAARRLYARLGFQMSGRRRGYYADPVEDAICMDLTVTP